MTIPPGTRRLDAVLPGEPTLRSVLDRLAREAPGCRVVELRSRVPPSEDLAALVAVRRSCVPLLGIAGGAVGAAGGWLLAYFTAHAFPVVTGHMPIVAGPPTGIVVYEGIALGAVLATTLGVVLEGRLGRRRSSRAAPPPGARGMAEEELARAVATGAIVLTLEAPDPQAERARRLLAEASSSA
ncbi:MAG TPA: quinol:electron acceptor oxidoreductase subunit ActD [Thermoanaerobaculia bacterium]|nr:quinol:electron acceptor oxidoreductase subunit ActD [Thermoanaerobaculia bacterium]